MRKLLIVLGVIVVLVVGGLFYVAGQAGGIIQSAVSTFGPDVIKAPVSLADVSVDVIGGKASLSGLVIGNPEGFKSDYAISVGRMQVALDVMSVMSDKVVIDTVEIDAPKLIYELGPGGGNIATIQKNAEATAASYGLDTTANEGAAGPTVVIHDLVIRDATVKLAATVLGGKGATVPLPDIHLSEIGAGDKGASPAEVAREILRAISGAVTKAVTSDKVKGLLKGVTTTGGNVGVEVGEKTKKKVNKAAKKAKKKLKSLFKKKKKDQ